MKNHFILFTLFLTVGLFSCDAGEAGATKAKDMAKDAASKVAATSQPTSRPVMAKNLPPLFNKILDAHGGLDTWNAMNTLKFTRGDGEGAEHHVVDLKSRRSTASVNNKYTMGNDGDKVWVTPHRDSFPGQSPTFMKNLLFYFVALPYV